jgi:23S rRNA pseudouridine2605 synthase
MNMSNRDSAEPEEPGMRINRYLSEAGKGSRRKVEDYVRQGRVQIEGETVQKLATRVYPGQEVRLDGAVVYPARKTVVFVMNKPVRVLVSEADPEGRPLAIDAVRPYYSGRLFSIGRLDYMSSGLILFTNDGDLAQSLMHPSAGIDREYVVETREPVTDEMLESFRHGIKIEGITYRLQEYRRHSSRRVSLILTEGKNREIRRVFVHFRLKVRRIYRNRYGPIRLGSLPDGQVRELNDEELKRLFRTAQKRTGNVHKKTYRKGK